MKRNFRPFSTLALIVSLTALFGLQSATGQTASLITTFTNPAPVTYGLFGNSVAAVGRDGVLVGAVPPYAIGDDNAFGKAYLFNTNGRLLTAFTNPAPEINDYFGQALAALGSDRVLIGAPGVGTPDAGVVYLFSTNGTLLLTFTNPPLDSNNVLFGFSVAAIGSDRVLIGALLEDLGAEAAGAAFMFSTNGALLTTFTNPTPATSGFGRTVAAIGSDRVLIGGDHEVYLFGTNGTLLQSFSNPGPEGNLFGNPVTAVGSGRVLIGAMYDSRGAPGGGAAYLFDTNGSLLTTFTNAAAAMDDRFGCSVADAGHDRVLIGSVFNDTGALEAGVAHLFSTSGALLTAITNPVPAGGAFFGRSIAVLPNDRVVIGADGTALGTPDAGVAYKAGVAYLLSIPAAEAPRLNVSRTATNTVLVSWPAPSSGYTLQQNTSLNTTNWQASTNAVTDDGMVRSIVLDPAGGQRFYRLFRP